MSNELVAVKAAQGVIATTGVSGAVFNVTSTSPEINIWLLTMGFFGWVIANAPSLFIAEGRNWGFIFGGLPMGLVLANFGTAGMVDLFKTNGWAEVDAHLFALAFGYSGSIGSEMTYKLSGYFRGRTAPQIISDFLSVFGFKKGD